MLLLISTEQKCLKRFTKKHCKKQIKKSLVLKKQLKENPINYMLNENAMITLLTVRLIKIT